MYPLQNQKIPKLKKTNINIMTPLVKILTWKKELILQLTQKNKLNMIND